jgi:Protein of unknown function (DUF3429)
MSPSPAPSSPSGSGTTAYALHHAVAVHPLAERLGYFGLIPFVLCALLSLIVREDAHPYVLLMLSGYAAVVLSFLGGIHWGLGMRTQPDLTTHYVWGVVPSLVGWVSVVMPAFAGLVIQGVMLVACYMVDRKFYPNYGASAWLTLRFRLTVIAGLSCFIGAIRT